MPPPENAPDYSGSDDYMVGAAPVGRYNFGDNRYVELLGNYASANIVNSQNWRFGPAVQYRFGRKDVDDPVVDRMSDVDGALQAGATFGYNYHFNNDIRHRAGVGIDVLQDVEGDKGLSATAYARYWVPVSRAVDVGLSGSVVYGSDDFNDTYYGISASDSLASGLSAYNADSGINAYRIMPMAMLHLSEQWHIGAGVRWERLTGDAADSPIVSERGDENQIAGGLGLIYAW
ncbi:MAG: MipA/OmpV family protein [Rickettsiales bacterium]